ncbi:MAG: AMP-binding protein, partial [Desulfobacterales bacterium]|nr:AMP-binding protein [Desulfobacterales bacterium]
QAYILDRHMQPVPVGVPGELFLGGTGLARGYLNRPDLTREKFIPHPFSQDPAQRLYRTGDLAAFLPDGQIRYLGRMDFQVKIRGFRIELEEVEAVIQSHNQVTEALVTVGEDRSGEKMLLAHVVPGNMHDLTEKELRIFLKDKLPAHMVPTHLMLMAAFPLNQSGKIDRNALPQPEFQKEEATLTGENRDRSVTAIIADIWKEVLGISRVSLHDNFFDIGGHSLLMVSVFTRLKQAFETDISLVDLYKYTTVQSLADFLGNRPLPGIQAGQAPSARIFGPGDTDTTKVAIIGIACRYPGAPGKDAFWENIILKKDCISTFSEEEMEENGIPLSMRRHRDFVPKSGWIDGLERFDADFFNITPAEARIIDPQHRIFMECAWEALEDAGIDLDRTDDITGIYAGCGQNAYFTHHLSQDLKLRQQMGDFNLMIGNSNDFLGSRIGYKFNLKGPMPTVQTACSTSMTGVHMACKGLFNRDCDIALAGGVSLGALQKGYLYREGMILSANGQCRPFDRDATGTVPSQGAGIVVLKRLDEAMRDRHHIYAVIAG